MAKMPEKYLIDVYGLLPVKNICNQILREVLSLQKVSIAHVVMNAKNISLLHKHSRTTEIYYILYGNGILYHGDNASQVEDGACLIIPPETPHKLQNTEKTTLEHLVFAIPPFNPEDLFLLNELDKIKEPHPKVFDNNIMPITAKDGAFIYELLSEEERRMNGVGLAEGVLMPQRKAISHFHEKSDEVYYIISGKGKIKIRDSISEIKGGNLIYIPKRDIHGLENTSAYEELEVLCLSCPPYIEKDFIFA